MGDHAHIEAKSELQSRGSALWLALHVGAMAVFFVIVAGRVMAASHGTAPEAFAAHCFSPYLTAETAVERLAPARVDFYDLRPFSSANRGV
jgi:hypothetical protein